MKVSELIEKLKGAPQDDLVVMSRDVEGNAFSPLEDLEHGTLRFIDGGRGDVSENPREGVACTLLWPRD